MPKLSRQPNGTFKARVRIPKDVAREYGALYGQRVENVLRLPAGTSDTEARQRYGEWLADHEGRVQSIRAEKTGEGRALTPYEARKLAGDWYTWWTARHATDSGIGLDERRDEVQRALREAAGPLLQNFTPDEAWKEHAHVREAVRPVLMDFAEMSQFLASKGVVVNNPSRDLLADLLYHDLAAALRYVQRQPGDLSADEYRNRFPKEVAASDSAMTLLDLFEQWRAERQPARGTVETWRLMFRTAQEHFTGRSAGSITPDEARAWVKSLSTATRSARTVRGTWLRALNTVFGWGVEQTLLARNPFAGIKVTVQKKTSTRADLSFRPSEYAVILKAASAIKDVSRPLEAAKRWVPWLCAYSGARPGEITQLRAEDIVTEEGVKAMRITPDAGTVKTRSARVVPLHEHVIAQGFLEFVAARKGPLFYNPPPRPEATEKKPRSAQMRQRLAAWVRSLGVSDPDLSPNHAWRHTFKQVAQRHGIEERMHDAITGHAAKTVGRTYGRPTLQDMADALRRFPRYNF